jgi:hypothetical protein
MLLFNIKEIHCGKKQRIIRRHEVPHDVYEKNGLGLEDAEKTPFIIKEIRWTTKLEIRRNPGLPHDVYEKITLSCETRF